MLSRFSAWMKGCLRFQNQFCSLAPVGLAERTGQIHVLQPEEGAVFNEIGRRALIILRQMYSEQGSMSWHYPAPRRPAYFFR